MSLAVGDQAPGFELPDTGGKSHALPAPGEAPATVLVWTCNHCPYALAWHERIQAVARDFAERGVVLAVEGAQSVLEMNTQPAMIRPRRIMLVP